VDSEFEDQQHFRKVFVVARRPIELSDISERNPLLTQLAAEFSSPKQNKTSKKPNKTPSRAYTYFTHESSVSDFSVFFSFLEKHGVKREVIKATFKIVLSPEELGLLPFAIYADPTRTNAHFQYDVAGRILLRDRDEVSSFRVVRMADLEVTRTYQFLRRILEALEINQRSKRGYEVLPWEQILV
jgi:hypothetical protein